MALIEHEEVCIAQPYLGASNGAQILVLSPVGGSGTLAGMTYFAQLNAGDKKAVAYSGFGGYAGSWAWKNPLFHGGYWWRPFHSTGGGSSFAISHRIDPTNGLVADFNPFPSSANQPHWICGVDDDTVLIGRRTSTLVYICDVDTLSVRETTTLPASNITLSVRVFVDGDWRIVFISQTGIVRVYDKTLTTLLSEFSGAAAFSDTPHVYGSRIISRGGTNSIGVIDVASHTYSYVGMQKNFLGSRGTSLDPATGWIYMVSAENPDSEYIAYNIDSGGYGVHEYDTARANRGCPYPIGAKLWVPCGEPLT